MWNPNHNKASKAYLVKALMFSQTDTVCSNIRLFFLTQFPENPEGTQVIVGSMYYLIGIKVRTTQCQKWAS